VPASKAAGSGVAPVVAASRQACCLLACSPLLAAGQRDARDGGHRSQRLATKAEGTHPFEVVERMDLRRRVPEQGQRQFVARDAATVVTDADQLDATFFELDLDRRTAGVEGVFKQFLEYRRRPIDDFAGSDLADQQIGQQVDSHGFGHRPIIPARLPVESRLADGHPFFATMEYLTSFIDIILHLDKHLAMLVQQYGQWIYAILFAIIFSETGFVVTPFLPGDSLLFVAGALAALGGMEIGLLLAVLMPPRYSATCSTTRLAAFSDRRSSTGNNRAFSTEALEKTHAFYEKHGGKTLVISRFLPLFRTFAPFVAGIGAMSYAQVYGFFNLIGGLTWVGSLTLAGYWFGNLPWIQKNLTLVIVAIILISLLPVFIGWLQHRKNS
jgi:membrane-associated protein